MSEDEPKVPTIVDHDGDRRIIRCAQIFLDNLDSIIGDKGPLRYVLRDEHIVPLEGSSLQQTPHDTMPQLVGQRMPLICTMEMSFPPSILNGRNTKQS